MKESLCRVSDGRKIIPNHHHPLTTGVVGTTVKDRSQNTNNIQGDHVVGEDIRVARCYRGNGALMPPSPETHPEDEDVERQEEKKVGEGKSDEDEGANSAVKACKEVRVEGGV